MKKVILAVSFLLAGMTAFAQETAPDVIVMKSGEEIEALLQEIGTDSVRYKKPRNPDGPVYTVPKSDIFMIRYANGEKDVFNDEPKPSLGGFGGSSTGDYKKNRFGVNLGIGGLSFEGSTDSLTAFDLGASYTYMFKSNSGFTLHLRPFFSRYDKSSVEQNGNGFQGMAGIRYIFPVIYNNTGRRQIAPYAAGKIGIGYLSLETRIKTVTDGGNVGLVSVPKTTTTVKTSHEGSSFCLELELGLEMNSSLYIALVYNFQGGTLDGKVTTTIKSEGGSGTYYPPDPEPVSTSFSLDPNANFFGFRVGYQF